MPQTISIDPITRIEGHLAIHVDIEGGSVSSARCSGEMFRGFEAILRGRDPLDAQQFVQRICGVCPVSHGLASVAGQEMAYGLKPPRNARLMRNLILGANYLQSHIIHFYHLAALDFIDIAVVAGYSGSDAILASLHDWAQAQSTTAALYPLAPFLPRYKGRYVEDPAINQQAVKHYVEGLEIRKMAHQMAALFSGKMPHPATIVPGGITEVVTPNKIAAYHSLLKRVHAFIDSAYIPDVEAVAKAYKEYFTLGNGPKNFLVYGVFPENDDASEKLFSAGVLINGQPQEFNPQLITEGTDYSFFSSPSGLRPYDGQTVPAPAKQGAYSWLKAPRYNGQVVEVGPAARLLVSYASGKNKRVKELVDHFASRLGMRLADLATGMGRHLARAVEAKIIAERCEEWLSQLDLKGPTFTSYEIPDEAQGFGLIEAPRGALGHWIRIKDKRIANYQCIVPTTWNCSPRDAAGTPGAVEQALVGAPVPDRENPLEVARVVRSFDPCLACAIH